MKKGKKLVSLFMAIVMLMSSTLIAVETSAVGLTKSSSKICGDLTFVVPEVIYLTPNGTSWRNATTSKFQYYVNNTSTYGCDTSLYTSTGTTGKIYYSLTGAGSATISYKFFNESLSSTLSGGSATLSSTSINSGSSVSITAGTSPSLAASTNGCYVEWCLSFTDPVDGLAKKAYAYSYVYKPYVVPVATGLDAGTGTSGGANWAGAVTWISGVHSITADANSTISSQDSWDGSSYGYTNSTGTNGFSAFISPASTALSGTATVTGSKAKVTSAQWKYSTNGATAWYASFQTGDTNASFNNLSNSNPSGYIGSSNAYTVKNLDTAKYRANTQNVQATGVGASVGNIYIDTSRYTDLQQVPNLAVGLSVTDDEDSSGTTGTWYIGDYTDETGVWTGTRSSQWHKDSDKRTLYYNDVRYKIAGQGTSATDTSYDETEGIRYMGAWPRTLLGSTTTQGSTYRYTIKGFYGNKDGNYYASAHPAVDLNVTYYNKVNLRYAVAFATKAMAKLGITGSSNGSLTSCYFDANTSYKWTAFQSAYKAAVIGLTKLNSTSNPDTLATNLNNALASLQTYYILDGNGGTISGNPYGYIEIGANQTANFTVTQTATRTGYILLGWSTDKDATTATTNVTVGYNNTLYAIWSPIEYSVLYNGNGGTGSMNASVFTYDVETPLRTNTFTKDGHGFLGWNTDPDASTALYSDGESVKNLSSTQGGQVNLYAIWSKNSYSITYNTYGGTEVPTATVYYEDPIPSAESTKVGHTFGGWTYTANGLTYYGAAMPGYDLIANAVWYKNLHHITYDTQGGTSVATADVYYDFTLPSATTSKVGYQFTGWTYTGNGEVYTGTKMPDFDLIATANFTINSHTITYNTNGGSAIATANVDYGSQIPSATTTREGYTFKGWTYTGNGSTYAGATMPDYNLVATANWEINSHTITYNTNGGTSVSTVTLDYGTAIPKATTSKTGSTFTGWTYTGNGSTYTGTTMPDYNLVATANFSINSHTIYFNTDGGSSVASITQDYGTAIIQPANPTRAGYTFNGWDQTIPNTMPDEDLYITASWTIHKYTVDFNMGGATPQAASIRAEYDDTVSVPEYESDFTKEGYDFGGWYENSDFSGNEIIGEYTIPAQSANNAHITLYAKWTVNAYTIDFDSMGGSSIAQIYEDYGTEITAPEDPVRAGYSFGGWYLNESCTGSAYTFTTMPAENLILYAKWTMDSHTITYKLNPSDTEAYHVDTYNYGESTSAIANPTKEGYKFEGWYENSNYSGNQYSFGSMPARDITLYAKWSINSHKITFANTGDTVMQTITLNYNETIPAISDPVREGYKFEGWNTDIPERMPDNDINLVASWSVNTYHIYYYMNATDTEPYLTSDFVYSASIINVPEPSKTGYSFKGWYENSDLSGSAYVFNTMPSNNITVYAKFDAINYTVKYKLNSSDTTFYATDSYIYGDTIVEPANPTKTGYDFVRWNYKNAENNSTYSGSTIPDYSLIAVAEWSINQYTIYFENTGDTVITPITQDYNTSITTPSNPTRAGYTFDGWDVDIPDTMPAGDVTVTAKWTIHSYVVDFDMGGSTPQTSSITANYNEAIDMPVYGTDFNYVGYRFDGWYDSNGNLIGTTYTLPALSNNGAHITLTARWTVNRHQLSFVTNSDTVIAPETVNYGDTITAPESPVKAGYDFAGWYENENLTGSRYSFPSSMPDRNVTLYAKWTEHNYTVVFLQPDDYLRYESEFDSDIKFDNHDSFETFYLDYNSSLESLPVTNPDLAYYNFVKWIDEEGNEVTSGWIMPAVDGETYYIRPVYSKVPIDITTVVEGPVITDSSIDSITGFIFNAGDQKTKAQIESMFDSTGYSDVVVTPSKGKYCGTGTKIEIIDSETNTVIKTYYLVVYGDVNGDGVCKSNDLSICRSMITSSDRSWYVKDSAANSAELRTCYELAADVNGDGVLNSYDTAYMELYTIGLYTYSFDEDEDSDTYHKYVSCKKA